MGRPILCLFLQFGLAAAAEAGAFMSVEPVRVSTELSRTALAAHFAGNFATGIPAILGAYGLGGLPGGGAMTLYELLDTEAQVAVTTRGWLSLRNSLKRHKELQEVANLPGVKLMRAVTTSTSEVHGLATVKLDSNVFLFVDTTEDLAVIDPAKWLPIDDLEGTKLRFSLQIDGAARPVAPFELALKDAFAGASIPEEARQEWSGAIQEWKTRKKSIPLKDRIRHSGLKEELRVDVALSEGTEQIPLGELARGSKATNLVEGSAFRRAWNWVLKKRGREPVRPHLSVENLPVSENSSETSCALLFQRLLGKAYVRSAP